MTLKQCIALKTITKDTIKFTTKLKKFPTSIIIEKFKT